MRWLTKFLAFGLLTLWPCPLVMAQDGGLPVLRAVDAARLADGSVRVAMDLDRPVTPKVFALEEPARLVIDLPATSAAVSPPRRGEGVVARFRLGTRPDGSSRLVLDLAGPARFSHPRAETGEGGRARILVTVRPADQASASESVARVTPAPSRVAKRPTAPPPRETPSRGRRVIVIDAGHGGHDPGALGVNGAREKAVVLAAALALREALESRGSYHVVLTRDGDRFLKLQDRVGIARENRADLFISLHADSSPNAQARGASVYTLSERGGERAKDVMEAQDWDMDLGDAPHSAQVEKILVDLAQRETTNRSAEFAEILTGELSGGTPLLNRSHRNAGFFVLLAPDVPAVLLEMGFLTNPQDEVRLTDPKSRLRMMGAVADAIDVYFARPRDYAGQ